MKAIADPAIRARARFVVYGANAPLTLAADHAGIDPFWYRIPADSPRLSTPIDEPVVVRDYVEFGDLLGLLKGVEHELTRFDASPEAVIQERLAASETILTTYSLEAEIDCCLRTWAHICQGLP